MSASVIVHRVGLDDLAVSQRRTWRDEVDHQLRAGGRMVTLYGRPDGDYVLVTAVLANPDGSLWVGRTRVARETGYHALTADFPEAQAFERELHEQTGVRLGGHPWLKPIRFEGKDQSAMRDYPYYKVEGKEVHEVAVGPIHAGVIEPGSFRFMCTGEQVRHLEIQLGYQHRGVEALLLAGPLLCKGPLLETVAGDSSVAYAWAFAAAVESLTGAEAPPEAEAARAVALELERVGMHLASLSGLAADIGHLQGATTYGRLRTTAINTLMRLSGSRFGRGAVRPGGAGLAMTAAIHAEVEAAIALLRTDVAIIHRAFLAAASVRHRLRGVGVVSQVVARSIGLVGPAARASGVALDGRNGRGVYAEHPVAAALFEDGDCWARARIRIAEIDASLTWLDAAMTRHATFAPTPRLPAAIPLAPRSLVVTVVEGWRGEVVHAVETDDAGGLAHYKVQDPSLRNWFGLALAVRENEISDFPICNKSFDLSYAGNDL